MKTFRTPRLNIKCWLDFLLWTDSMRVRFLKVNKHPRKIPNQTKQISYPEKGENMKKTQRKTIINLLENLLMHWWLNQPSSSNKWFFLKKNLCSKNPKEDQQQCFDTEWEYLHNDLQAQISSIRTLRLLANLRLTLPRCHCRRFIVPMGADQISPRGQINR